MLNLNEQIPGELAKAIIKVQGNLAIARKDSKNPHFKSLYADLNSVWDACRQPLTDNGIAVIQIPTDAGEGRVGLTTVLIHSSGQFISGTVSTKIAKDDPQGVGSALTYLRRYSLASMVGIVADVDDDGNAASLPPQNYGTPPSISPRQPVADQENEEIAVAKAIGLASNGDALAALIPRIKRLSSDAQERLRKVYSLRSQVLS